ncbi:transcription elongation factor GreA [Acetivibrio clariflavus]|uniref:Transcription elongation factor GreA n=1 Tax=Acetivibrio clariflavus (strain DSM 19732 / NBRC 101661 / EBR45) TaxID=720554 RepID=G8M2I2_ACECE|nr:transcription elongation factor GreA [Acetivibrio clariflavus]AEV70352.1 transcription elongation factor GreA [Acetivibrio clariflavus DSM 19732]HOQ01066.1 transcription elongation factor GreA [Acetivibrio clariflavus]
MVNKEVVLTYEGLQKLEQELEFLKTVKRREVAERIKQALSFGDISENSEYDEAKNEQAHVEGRIVQLENMLKNAKVIDEDDVKTDVVSLGSKVILLDMEYNEEIEYYIVGSAEANPSEFKISNESPVGRALMGKEKGTVVDVVVPDGIAKYKIIDIKK